MRTRKTSAAKPRTRRPARAAQPSGSAGTATAVGPLTTRPEAEERRLAPRAETSDSRMNRTLDAVPDRVDVRDFIFPARLTSLPREIVNCGLVPEILDQGTEGACTGFALAAVINFLLAQ